MKTKAKKQTKICIYIRYRKIFAKKVKKNLQSYFFVVPLYQRNKKQYTMLTDRVTIYVPSTTEGNKPAKRLQKKVSKHVAKKFFRMFGGCTQQAANGFWMSDKKGLIAEKQNLIFAACTPQDRGKHLQDVLTIAKAICKYMKQEAVTVDNNGTLLFVEA